MNNHEDVILHLGKVSGMLRTHYKNQQVVTHDLGLELI